MSVSVIMPFYRKRKYLASSIDSVLSQTYSNFEIIIVYDDADINDYDYVKNFEKKDPRIKVIKNQYNLGAGPSRNIGIKFSSKKYIAFLDCDDIWDQNKLRIQIDYMIKSDVKVSYTSYNIIDLNDNLIGSRGVKKNLNYLDLLKSCDIGLSTVILKRELINEYCQFPNLTTKEDYVLWLKIAKNNIIFIGMDEKLTKWRKLSNSLSANTFQKISDGYKVYNKYMNFNKLMSLYCLFRLSINYLKKQ